MESRRLRVQWDKYFEKISPKTLDEWKNGRYILSLPLGAEAKTWKFGIVDATRRALVDVT